MTAGFSEFALLNIVYLLRQLSATVVMMMNKDVCALYNNHKYSRQLATRKAHGGTHIQQFAEAL